MAQTGLGAPWVSRGTGRRFDAPRLPLRRRFGNVAFRVSAALGTAVVLAFLAALTVSLVEGSRPAWHWSVLTTTTQGTAGGLLNAILGTLWLAFWTLLFVVVAGVAAGTYLVEFAPSWFREATLFVSDIVAGIPSIVFGYVGYLLFVLAFGWGFSTLAAALTLAMVVLPYMVRNSAQAVAKVPTSLREAALALGLSRVRTIWTVVWPEALSGLVTGMVLSVAVAMGETAPLLYTAEWSQQLPSLHLTHHSVGYLTYVVWTFVQEPYPEAIALAYTAGLLLLVLIGGLAVLGRMRRRI
ncbi:MAG: phosphate ABC transporter permease PstA [Actinomycetia bacterium]|nr:phosphate ABC transporter permease PstA [Actinomycetes bacterium]